MWPRRKIQLVASPTAVGIKGVRAVLNELRLEFTEVEPAMGDPSQVLSEAWLERPLDWVAEDPEPVTELVFWPEVSEEDVWRARALARGIKQQSIQSFLHSLFEDEFILLVSGPPVLIEGRPLLGHILNQAGFEPSLLWPAAEGEWTCERKPGSYWVLPDFWLEGLMKASSLGRESQRAEEKSTWVVRERELDFYRAPEGQRFVGRLPRWPEEIEEQAVGENIVKCLDLGVSWADISLALTCLGKNIISTDDLRWKIDDFGWNGGSGGEKLSAVSIDHVEDWGSG